MGVFIGNGYGQVTFVFSTPGAVAPFVVTHGIRDVPGTANAAAAAAAWVTAFGAAGRPLIAANFSTSYTWDRCDVTIGTATGPILATQVTNTAGTNALSPATINCAELVRKSTARGGRRGRGRNFWPPIHVDEGNIGPTGTIATAQLTAVQAMFSAAYTALAATSYPPYLLHDTSEIAPDAVTGWALQARVATQRTRLRK